MKALFRRWRARHDPVSPAMMATHLRFVGESQRGEHAAAGAVEAWSSSERVLQRKLDDGWPESEKRIFQAALSMVVVKNSR